MSDLVTKPLKERYFEDYRIGDVYEFGRIEVSREEIIQFATRYDPQSFHIDPDAARDSIYGDIIASGWHTGSMLMRCLVDNYISPASLGSPGVENIRWPVPVRGGDILRARVTVVESRLSRSKPDRGIVISRSELLNQNDQTVMEMSATNFVRRRVTE